ncbi:MAG: tetratricopeptide repeat protein [Bacteroidia bacterium]|nr:tetratricopeptide repeat protein [Bacteroidia bacterium]
MKYKQYILVSSVILIVFSCIRHVQAQESLIYYRQQQTDSTLVQQLLEDAKNVTVPDSSITYAEAALAYAKELDYQPGIRDALIILGDAYLVKGDLTGSLRYGLEILKQLEASKDWNNLLTAYFRIGTIYQREGLYEKAIEYYTKADELPWEQKPIESKIQVTENIGDCYTALSNIDSAVLYYQKILEHYTAQNSNSGIIKAHRKMVSAYGEGNDFEKALQHNLIIKKLVRNEGSESMAVVNNNIGHDYNKLGQYKKAIFYFESADSLASDSKMINKSVLYTNLGIAYNNAGDLNKSVEYLSKAQEGLTDRDNSESKAYLDHLIANIYLANEDIYNAQVYNDKSLAAAKAGPFPLLLSDSYYSAAQIHQSLYEYENALEYYQKYFALRDSFKLEERLRQQELLQQQFLLERSEKEIKLLLVNQDIKDLTINQLNLEKEKLQLTTSNLELEKAKAADEILLLKEAEKVKEAQLKNQMLDAERVAQALQLSRQRTAAAEKDREISELNRIEEQQRQALILQEETEKRQLQEIENLDLLNQTKEQELDRQKQRSQFIAGLGGLLAVILALIFVGLVISRRANKKLAQQNQEINNQRNVIEKEKEKSDELLLNILPQETADELKTNGIATPRNYDKVSVLFTDFVNFTKVAEHLSPDELIEELNSCFVAFDKIIGKYNLEKIKTIGDSYMCAGGIPSPNDSNPTDAVKAAIEIRDFMTNHIAERRAAGLPSWDMRIGIHTGKVIAGVVGLRKFAYDIWGDAVNTASRMESSGEQGKINISDDTYQLVKDQFQCSYRGEIEAKNKGKIGMYFVNEEKVANVT